METNNQTTELESKKKDSRKLRFRIEAELSEMIAKKNKALLRRTPNKGVAKDSVFSAIFWENVRRGYTLSDDSEITDDKILGNEDAVERIAICDETADWYIQKAKEIAREKLINSYWTVINYWLKKGLGADVQKTK